MFKRLILTASIILGLTLGAQATSLNDALKGTVKLYSSDTGICSATLVADDVLLTAGHCVNEKDLNIRVQVKDKDFNLLREEIIYVDVSKKLTDLDLAILTPKDKLNSFKTVLGNNISVVSVATPEQAGSELWTGADIWTIGYPKAMELTVTQGLFTGVVESPTDLEASPVYQITAPITGGNSGGGLYIRVDGEFYLVGVTVAGFRDVSFMNYATNNDNVQKILKGFVEADFKSKTEKSPSVPSMKTDEK